jgi:hypothetical protein
MKWLAIISGLLMGLLVTPASAEKLSCEQYEGKARFACWYIQDGFEAVEKNNGFYAKLSVQRAEDALANYNHESLIDRFEELKRRTNEVRNAGHTTPSIQIAN